MSTVKDLAYRASLPFRAAPYVDRTHHTDTSINDGSRILCSEQRPLDKDSFCKDCWRTLTGDWQLYKDAFSAVRQPDCEICKWIYQECDMGQASNVNGPKDGFYFTREQGKVYAKLSVASRVNCNIHMYSSTGGAFGRAIWSCPTTYGLEQRLATIQTWIHQCKKWHKACQNMDNSHRQTAARLLYVKRHGRGFCLRLVRVDDMNVMPNYTVLTHCWGGADMPFKTTRQTLDRYMKAIDFDALPLTFKEAILLTAGLGYSYIWIDTLCVVQDDKMDWSRESAKMADIYRRAILTLSATMAPNAYEGCGILAPVSPAKQFHILPDRPGTKTLTVSLRANQLPLKTARPMWRDAPIEKRAWTLQERLLSRRIVHMDGAQFRWQCTTHTEMEDGIEGTSYAMVNDFSWRPLESHQVVYQDDGAYPQHLLRARWWDWMHNYTRRSLSYPSDNYAALAGITRFFQEISNDEPIVGLWRRDLPVHLLWSIKAPTDIQYAERQPSWTWMTFPHAIQKGVLNADVLRWGPISDHKAAPAIKIVYVATVFSTDVSWTGEPLISQPSKQCIITLQSKTFNFQLPLDDTGARHSRDGSYRLHLDPDIQDPGPGNDEFDSIMMVAFRYRSFVQKAEDSYEWEYDWRERHLVIRRNPGCDTWRRIGRLETTLTKDPTDRWHSQPTAEIKLA